MYRILIVDDEKIERNGIKMLLKMGGFDLEVHEACNGKEALEFLETQQVDILLTDMKMPYIDGMELLKRVSAKDSHMKCIIFSGYSEFEYAKNAMKMGVKDYILKPVDPEEFRKTMTGVLEELDQQAVSLSKEAETDSFMKEHILYSLVNGMDAEVVRSRTERFYDEKEINHYNRMLLLEVRDDFFGKTEENMDEFFEGLIPEKFKFLNLNEQQSVLFVEDVATLDFKELAEKILEAFSQKYSRKCYVAVSEKMETPVVEIGGTFEALENCMESKFYYPDSRVFLQEEKKESGLFEKMDEDALSKQLKQDMKMKDISSLREHFETMCHRYRQNSAVSQAHIKFMFSNLLKDFYEFLPEDKEQNLDQEIEELYNATEIEQVLAVINRNIDRLEQEFGCNPQMNHREIESVKKYIYENYSKEISVDYLAEMVYMAPSYLSHVFKKETGQNLSKFIKAYRMEKAREMLEETHNKIVNISLEVGYPNVSYFCQSFREYFGVSPQKFRDQN
jgi:two-component system response regulator YesN